jgi:uncharacterized protein YkwD
MTLRGTLRTEAVFFGKFLLAWGGGLVLLYIVVTGAGGLVSDAGGGAAGATINESAAEAAVVERLNDRRTAAGVGALSRDHQLRAAAREHGRDMHKRDFYAHENPDGERAHDRLRCRAAEVIHRGEIGTMQYDGDETIRATSADRIAEFVVVGWANSREHRQLMTSGEYGRVGVGIVIQDGGFFAVAMFC